MCNRTNVNGPAVNRDSGVKNIPAFSVVQRASKSYVEFGENVIRCIDTHADRFDLGCVGVFCLPPFRYRVSEYFVRVVTVFCERGLKAEADSKSVWVSLWQRDVWSSEYKYCCASVPRSDFVCEILHVFLVGELDKKPGQLGLSVYF